MSVKKKHSVFFNLAALLIVLGHMVVPHHHHSDYEEHYCETQEEVAFLGSVARFFHPDLGEEHLEEWTQEDPSNFDFFLPESGFLPAFNCVKAGTPTHQTTGHTKDAKSSIQLRGPPLKA